MEPTPTPRCAHALAHVRSERERQYPYDMATTRTCAACGAEVLPRVRVTFEIVTPESAEDGDYAATGWINEDGIAFDDSDLDADDPDAATYGDAIARFIDRDGGPVECSGSEITPHYAPWFSACDATVDYRTGAEERRSWHVEGLTGDEWRTLFAALLPRTRLRVEGCS